MSVTAVTPNLTNHNFLQSDLTIEQGATLRDLLIEDGAIDQMHQIAERHIALYSFVHPSVVALCDNTFDNRQQKEAFSTGVKIFESIGAMAKPNDTYDESACAEAAKRSLMDIENHFRLYDDPLGIIIEERYNQTKVLYNVLAKVLNSRYAQKPLVVYGLAGGAIAAKTQSDVDEMTAQDPFFSL